MQMPKPTDAHRKLEKLAGSWHGEEQISPSPLDPVGGKAFGRLTNRLALDGFVVLQDYEQERDGVVNFRGHGVFGWDAAQSRSPFIGLIPWACRRAYFAGLLKATL